MSREYVGVKCVRCPVADFCSYAFKFNRDAYCALKELVEKKN